MIGTIEEKILTVKDGPGWERRVVIWFERFTRLDLYYIQSSRPLDNGDRLVRALVESFG